MHDPRPQSRAIMFPSPRSLIPHYITISWRRRYLFLFLLDLILALCLCIRREIPLFNVQKGTLLHIGDIGESNMSYQEIFRTSGARDRSVVDCDMDKLNRNLTVLSGLLLH